MTDTASTPELPSTLTTVLIADDHALVRDGLKLLLGGILGRVHFLEAQDGPSLMQVVRQNQPIHLGLVDLNMPGMEGGFRLAELARLYPALPLVVVSAMTSPDVVRRTLDIASVFAFVPKSAGSEHMHGAIAAALRGEHMPYLQQMPQAGAHEPGLTPRMAEVRDLVRQGMSNKLIARTLGISEGTVKNHMSEIFKVLKVSNRTQAAQLDTDVL